MTNAREQESLHRPLELATAIPALVGAAFVLMHALMVYSSAHDANSPYRGEPMPVLQVYSFFLGVAGVLTGIFAVAVVLGRRWGLLALGVGLTIWTLLFLPSHRFPFGLLTGLGAGYLLSRYHARANRPDARSPRFPAWHRGP